MDVMRLEENSGLYLPGALIEDYTTMIWTERYFTSGGFELHTPKIEETKALIPEGTLLTHRDTKEVMQVETHTIQVNKAGVKELVTEGRTIESFLENRVATGVHGEPWSTYKNYKTSEIIALLLWNHLVNATGQDPTRVGTTKDVEDALPGFAVTNSTNLTETPVNWSLQEGDVYPQLTGIVGLSGIGVRGIRPPGTSGNVVSFDTGGGSTRGDISTTTMPDISDIRLDVYNGLDRTRFQTDRDAIIFHYDSGHIDEPSYLFSIKDLKNLAVVSSDIGNIVVWPETGTTPPSTPPTGLDRRVLFVDGGTQGDALLPDFTQAIIQKGMVELAKHNRMILFDGAISPVSPYIYGAHYFLGDLVSVMAQYGFEQEMIVAEHVRTEDIAGERGYPTLVLPS